MGTKNNPGKFDCYDKAEPDEPMFVLLARDSMAPRLVREWASCRIDSFSPPTDDEKVLEARQCADDMVRWYVKNRAYEILDGQVYLVDGKEYTNPRFERNK